MKIFCVWHLDLRFRNKTHFQRPLNIAQSEHDLILLVRKSSYISPEITDAVSHLVRVPINLPGLFDHLLLLFYSLGYFIIFRRRRKFEGFWSTPHANLLSGVIVKLLFGNRIYWICDLFDDPRRQNHEYHGIFCRIFNCFYNCIVARIVKKADLIITIGTSLNRELPLVLQRDFNVLRKRLLCVTNGVDLDMFQPDNSVKKVNGNYQLFFVGYVGHYTGVGTLLEATSQLRNRIEGLKLVLVGFTQPYEVVWLQNEIVRLGLNGYVDFLGIVESEEVPKLIAASDVCIHPFPAHKYLDLVYPIKVYEYLAMGKPVISSDLTAIRCIIKDGENGILVKPEDSVAMAEAVYRIYVDMDLCKRLKKNARTSVEQFDWRYINKMIIDRLSLYNHHRFSR